MMKKIILLIFVAGFCKAQKTFINESVSQVSAFWKTKTTSENIKTVKDEVGNVIEINILVGKSGNPYFSALFIEGKCGRSVTLTKDSKMNDVTENLKKNGFVFDKKENTWYNDKKQIAIYLEDIYGEEMNVIAQAYWLLY